MTVFLKEANMSLSCLCGGVGLLASKAPVEVALAAEEEVPVLA